MWKTETDPVAMTLFDSMLAGANLHFLEKQMDNGFFNDTVRFNAGRGKFPFS